MRKANKTKMRKKSMKNKVAKKTTVQLDTGDSLF